MYLMHGALSYSVHGWNVITTEGKSTPEQEKVTKGNHYKNIDVRVMDLVHDTLSHQGLSFYELLFQKYK